MTEAIAPRKPDRTAAEWLALKPSGRTTVDVMKQFPLSLSVRNPDAPGLVETPTIERTEVMAQFAESGPEARAKLIASLPERSQIRTFLSALHSLNTLRDTPNYDTALKCRTDVFYYVWNDGMHRIPVLHRWALLCYENAESDPSFRTELVDYLLTESQGSVQSKFKPADASRPFTKPHRFYPSYYRAVIVQEANSRYPAEDAFKKEHPEEWMIQQYLKAKPELPTFEYTAQNFSDGLAKAVEHTVPERFQAYCWEKNISGTRRLIILSASHPRFPGFVAEVAAHLKTADARLSSVPSLTNFTLEHLEELLRACPTLVDDTTFVPVYVHRLHQLRGVEVVWSFVRDLSPLWYEGKRSVLFRLLQLAWKKHQVDEDLLMAFLELPGRDSTERHSISFEDYPSLRSGKVSTLVDAMIDKVMLDTQRIQPYNKYFPDKELEDRLRQLQIDNDIGAQQHLDKLSASQLSELYSGHVFEWLEKDVRLGAKDQLTLRVRMRNVNQLLVRLFEVSTVNLHSLQPHTNLLNLDLLGLEPQTEEVQNFDFPKHKVVEHTLSFPGLSPRGLFICEVIENNHSTRAVISKGFLKYRSRQVASGTEVVIMDEEGEVLKDAKFYVRDHTYPSGGVVPFSVEPGACDILMEHEQFMQPGVIHLFQEAYDWTVGLHIPREELAPGRLATGILTIRLQQTGLEHLPAPLSLLSDLALTVTSETFSGVTNQIEITALDPQPSGVATFHFSTPPQLLKLSCQVTAKVRHTAQEKTTPLHHSSSVVVNKHLLSSVKNDYYLRRTPEGHKLCVIGKGGEPCFLKKLTVELWSKWFNERTEAKLQLDENGEYLLGDLSGYASLRIRERTWNLRAEEQQTDYTDLVVAEGESISLPYYAQTPMDSVGEPVHFHLWNTETATPQKVSLRDRRLEVAPLPAGRYQLRFLLLGKSISIKVLPRSETRPTYNPQPASLASVEFQEGAAPGPSAKASLGATLDGLVAAATETSVAAASKNDAALVAKAKELTRHTIAVQEHTTRLGGAGLASAFEGIRGAVAGLIAIGKRYAQQPTPELHLELGEHLGAMKEAVRQLRSIAPAAKDAAAPSPANAVNKLVIRLANASPHTRVHVIGQHFLPPAVSEGAEFASLPIQQHFSLPQAPDDHQTDSVCKFAPVVALDDTVRYIWNRRFDKETQHQIGNMLPQPTLLLKRWDVTKPIVDPVYEFGDKLVDRLKSLYDEASRTLPALKKLQDASDRWDSLSKAAMDSLRSALGNLAEYDDKPYRREGGDWAQALHFADVQGFPAANLQPNKDGVVEVSLADAPATVGSFTIVITELAAPWISTHVATRPAPRLSLIDHRYLRLASPSRSFTKQSDGGKASLPRSLRLLCNTEHPLEVDASEKNTYDTLPSVFAFFQSFSRDTTLKRFRFVTEWAQLSHEAKLAKLDKFMCAELNVFIYFKDRNFFDKVVGPYLRHKLHKSVLDMTLLDMKEELQAVVASTSHFASLNAFEKVFVAHRLGRVADAVSALRSVVQDQEADPGWTDFQFKSALEGQRLQLSGSEEIAPPARPLANPRSTYQDLKKEKTYAEADYFHLPPERDTGSRVAPCQFWLDYAKHLCDNPGRPFASVAFVQPVFNFTEMMLTLAVLDLPATPSAPLPPPGHTYAPATPALVFMRQLVEAQESIDQSLMVLQVWSPCALTRQRFFDAKDRYKANADGEKEEVYMTEKFERQRVYGCALILNNLSGIEKKLDVSYSIPNGAVSLSRWFTTSSSRVVLKPYTTQAFTFFFYFPRAGTFQQNPAQLSRGLRVVAKQSDRVLRVVSRAQPAPLPESADADRDAAYVERFDLPAHHTFHTDKESELASGLEQYRRALVFDPAVWDTVIRRSTGRLQESALREFIELSDLLTTPFESRLFSIGSPKAKLYRFLESSKAITPRLFEPGSGHYDIPAKLHAAFTEHVVWKPSLDVKDLLMATYYAVLRSDLPAAKRLFERIKPDDCPFQLQYAYLAAYLEFSYDPTDKLAAAEGAVAKYANHPIRQWRLLFQELKRQLAEIRGDESVVPEALDSALSNELNAKGEATLKATAKDDVVTVLLENVERLEVGFYKLDLEVLFSKSPFEEIASDRFQTLQPNALVRRECAGEVSVSVPVPTSLRNCPLLIIARSGPKFSALRYGTSQLNVQVMSNFGQLKVIDRAMRKPIPGAYVKVYGKTSSSSYPIFYKDGFTDRRGRFDYVTLNSPDRQQCQLFALLVQASTGSEIRVVEAPLK